MYATPFRTVGDEDLDGDGQGIYEAVTPGTGRVRLPSRL